MVRMPCAPLWCEKNCFQRFQTNDLLTALHQPGGDNLMTRNWVNQVRTTIVLAAAFIISAQAFAGDTLHFKTGDVNSQVHAAQLAGRALKSGTAYYIVQFNDPIRLEDRQNLTTLGAKIVRYVPDDALVVKATAAIVATIKRSSTAVHEVLPFEPRWRQSTDFTPASVFSARDLEEVYVRLFPNEDETRAEAEIRSIPGVQVVVAAGRSLVVRAARPQVESIAAVEAVEWVQPNPKFQSYDMKIESDSQGAISTMSGDYTDLSGYESGTKVMNFEAAWNRGFTGKGQIAAMADTGLDKGDIATIHKDFAGRIVSGYALGLFAKTWEDPMGHGTHVAGSIVGNGTASGGKVRGGAYDAQFVAVGMWSPMLDNLSIPAKLSDLFSKAYGDGARIHSNSWGSPQNFGAYDSFAQQADEYLAANQDMLVLFAAGNSGVDADKDGRVDINSIGSPGTAKNVLTVGASKNYVLKGGYQMKLSETKLKDSWPVEPLASSKLSESAAGLAAFSSRGPTQDGRIKPEIVSPGTNILSNRTRVPGAELLWGAYNDDYVWSGGTSMATPLTAGAATVVRQYLVDDRKIAKPSGALVKAVLMHTAFDLFPGQFGALGKDKGQELLSGRPNNDEGYGRVDLDKATNLGKAIIVDEHAGLATGDMHKYPLQVSGGGKLTATLVYTDAAASVGAAKALVNDLDLVVVDPAGHETTLGDHTNNTEMIEMQAQGGNYEIRVKGTNVPQGPVGGRQPYALVITVN
jgi:serine protease AprX